MYTFSVYMQIDRKRERTRPTCAKNVDYRLDIEDYAKSFRITALSNDKKPEKKHAKSKELPLNNIISSRLENS